MPIHVFLHNNLPCSNILLFFIGLATLKFHLSTTRGLCHQLLSKEIVLGHFSLCEFGSYEKWMEEYSNAGQKESSQLSSLKGTINNKR